MEEKKSHNTFEKKKLGIRYSKSLSFPYNNKMMSKELFEDHENNINNKTNINKSSILYKMEKEKDKEKEKENHLLIFRKINIKDKNNKFYKEGVNDIFNDENLFLNNIYKDKKVIIGRNKSYLYKPEYITHLNSIKNKGNFNKFRFYKSSTLKNNPLGKIRRNEISKSLRGKNAIDKNLINAYDYQDKNNNSICSINSKHDKLRKSFNLYGKRAPIFISGQNLISDNELKILYHQFLEKEKENRKKELKKKELNVIDKDNDNKNKTINKDINDNINKKIFKSMIDREINSRLNLQEKILNKFQRTNKVNQKLINKILKYTSKNNNDLLLMKHIDDYRYKMEKIDEEKRMNQDNNYNKTIYWLSSLRHYPRNKVKNKDGNKVINNNTNNSTFPSIYTNRRKGNISKDDIFDNYINNIQYSFGNNSNLYCDIESNIIPLYAFILSDNLKGNEKIRNTHIDDYYNLNNKNNSLVNNKIKKNISVPSLNNKYFLNEKNSINDLNVEGKRLIDYEIEMSKKLEGKKKRLIKINYNDDETSVKTFAKSTLLDSFYYPKSIKNAFELHYNKES